MRRHKLIHHILGPLPHWQRLALLASFALICLLILKELWSIIATGQPEPFDNNIAQFHDTTMLAYLATLGICLGYQPFGAPILRQHAPPLLRLLFGIFWAAATGFTLLILLSNALVHSQLSRHSFFLNATLSESGSLQYISSMFWSFVGSYLWQTPLLESSEKPETGRWGSAS